jgi:hypothetical protein
LHCIFAARNFGAAAYAGRAFRGNHMTAPATTFAFVADSVEYTINFPNQGEFDDFLESWRDHVAALGLRAAARQLAAQIAPRAEWGN